MLNILHYGCSNKDMNITKLEKIILRQKFMKRSNLQQTKFSIIIDRVQDIYEEQEFWMTRLDWVGIWLNQFEMFEEHENCLSRRKQCCSRWKQCWMKTMYR